MWNVIINSCIILVANWVAVFSGISLFKDNTGAGDGEGAAFAFFFYSFFALLLIPVIYLYSIIEKRLITNKWFLFMTALLSQAALWLGMEGIVEYKFIPSRGNFFVNLLAMYLIAVGIVTLILRLFRNKFHTPESS